MKLKKILFISVLTIGVISFVFTFTYKAGLGPNTDNAAITARADSVCSHCSGCGFRSTGEEPDLQGWTADDDLPHLDGDEIEKDNE
jgi:hypothetical protein